MPTPAKKTEEAKAAEKSASHPLLANLLVKPRISEKASRLAKSNQYVFVVTKNANKVELKKAVEQAYKVKVTGVNMVTVKGKHRTFGRSAGRTSDFKKAVVTLRKGDAIEGMEANI